MTYKPLNVPSEEGRKFRGADLNNLPHAALPIKSLISQDIDKHQVDYAIDSMYVRAF